MLTIPTHWLNAVQPLSIVLIGAGGTGSELLSLLVKQHHTLLRLGDPGYKLTVFDPDTVSESNIGRQNFYACDVGRNKAQTLVGRYNAFAGTAWTAHAEKLQDGHSRVLANADVIFSCTDSPAARTLIGTMGRNQRGPAASAPLWIDGGNSAHEAQVVMGHWSGAQGRIPNVLDLFPSLAALPERNEPSCSTEAAIQRQDLGINTAVAASMANLLWQLKRHGQVSFHGQYIDLRRGESAPMPISPSAWAAYGYSDSVVAA